MCHLVSSAITSQTWVVLALLVEICNLHNWDTPLWDWIAVYLSHLLAKCNLPLMTTTFWKLPLHRCCCLHRLNNIKRLCVTCSRCCSLTRLYSKQLDVTYYCSRCYRLQYLTNNKPSLTCECGKCCRLQTLIDKMLCVTCRCSIFCKSQTLNENKTS